MNGWIADKTVVFSDDQTRIVKKTFLKDQEGIVPSNIWWDVDDTGHNRNAKYELLKIFSEAHSSEVFKTPKPTKFIERILQMFAPDDLIVLDSFAGSGTTAHAVLNMNKRDGGKRRFILVEMEDYAESVTAERTRRVIDGYGDTPGTGGGFEFYELGERLLLEDGELNETLDIERIREYVWYAETKTPYSPSGISYYLGEAFHTAYWFYYERFDATTLDVDFLRRLKKAERHVIYANMCALSAADLERWGIKFKKIPRDIRKLLGD
jgi:adenine-specific DNA-methyltransferase